MLNQNEKVENGVHFSDSPKWRNLIRMTEFRRAQVTEIPELDPDDGIRFRFEWRN